MRRVFFYHYTFTTNNTVKLLIISPVFYTFCNYTTYAFIGAILAIVIIDLIQRLTNKEHSLDPQYEGVKEIFNNPNSKDYIEPKEASTTLEVVPLNFSAWSYRELQAIAKALGVTGRNRKRLILEQELLAVCK